MRGLLISIVVPVYNTAEYLDRCISSIVAENEDCFELILVDDGSTDGSGEICDSWLKRDSRIRVFHQANSGVSCARNLGLGNAKGLYIWFCDSDDEVANGALGCIMQVIRKASPDILVCSVAKVNKSGGCLGIIEAPRRPENMNDGPLQCGNALYTVAHVFRRTLADGLRFDTTLALLEDRDFFYRLCLRGIANTEVLDTPVYRYLVTREDSAINSPSLEKTMRAVEVDYRIFRSELERGFPHPAYEFYAERSLGALTGMGKHGDLVLEFKELRKQLLKFDKYSSSLSGKNRQKYLMVKMCPGIYRLICRAAVFVGAASRPV